MVRPVADGGVGGANEHHVHNVHHRNVAEQWAHNGRELFYVNGNNEVVAVEFVTDF